MTRHEERLAGILRRAIAGLSEEEAVKRLFELGAVSRRGCERLAIREEVARLEKRGMGRCEALHVAAGVFCCSYEKARKQLAVRIGENAAQGDTPPTASQIAARQKP